MTMIGQLTKLEENITWKRLEKMANGYISPQSNLY